MLFVVCGHKDCYKGNNRASRRDAMVEESDNDLVREEKK